MTVPFRLANFVLAAFCALGAAPVHAQTASPAAIPTNPAPVMAPVGDWALVIPPLPGGKITLEVDARDEDLLGLLKEFVVSMTSNASSAQVAVTTAQPARPAPASGVKKNVNKPAPGQKIAPPAVVRPPASNGDATGAQALYGSPWATLLAETGISATLKTVRHLHVVTVETPAAAMTGANAVDRIAFYEQAWQVEGGRLLVRSGTNAGSRFLLTGFSAPRKGWALVSEGGNKTTIVRGDGYPNVTALASLAGFLGISGSNGGGPDAK